jgi:SAM-dependent methyltransferase
VIATGAAHPSWNPWANDSGTLELYRRRCRREAEEMTCAAQAAEILAPLVEPGESLLDAGCGGGYYLWSLRDRGVDVDYHGLDFTPEMVELAREETAPAAGLDPSRFELGAIERLEARYDTVLCFNVLTNSPHYGLGLERLLRSARRRILLRESLGPELIVRFTPDPYLDEGARHIRVYHNCYPVDEVQQLMEAEGFAVTRIPDRRTGDGAEMVVDIPHTWRILLGQRT